MLNADEAGARGHMGVGSPTLWRVQVMVGGCGPAQEGLSFGERGRACGAAHTDPRKFLSELIGDCIGHREEVSQLSFSKAFSWGAEEHLLRGFFWWMMVLSLGNKGFLTQLL